MLCGARERAGEAWEEDRQVLGQGGEGTELRQEESGQFSVVHRLGLKSSEGAVERLMRAVGLSTGGCGWLSWPGWRPGDLRMGSAGPWGWKQQLAWRCPCSGFSGNFPGPEGNSLRGACLFRAIHPGVFPGSPSASGFPDRCLLMRGPTRAHHLGAPGHLKIAQGQERHRGGSVSLRNPAGDDSLPSEQGVVSLWFHLPCRGSRGPEGPLSLCITELLDQTSPEGSRTLPKVHCPSRLHPFKLDCLSIHDVKSSKR